VTKKLGGGSFGALERSAMTRPAIERCIYVFILALVVAFAWTVMRVMMMLGWA